MVANFLSILLMNIMTLITRSLSFDYNNDDYYMMMTIDYNNDDYYTMMTMVDDNDDDQD